MMKLQAVLSGFILTFCLRYSVYVSFIITGDFFGELVRDLNLWFYIFLKFIYFQICFFLFEQRLFSIYKRGLETRIDCFRVCEVSTSMNQIQIDKLERPREVARHTHPVKRLAQSDAPRSLASHTPLGATS
ncbi:hypothetical protein YC2023_055368 [Brassica napus]